MLHFQICNKNEQFVPKKKYGSWCSQGFSTKSVVFCWLSHYLICYHPPIDFIVYHTCHSAVNLVTFDNWKEFIANNNKFYKTLDNIETTEGAGVVKVSKHSPWRRNPQLLPEKEKGVSYQLGVGAGGAL